MLQKRAVALTRPGLTQQRAVPSPRLANGQRQVQARVAQVALDDLVPTRNFLFGEPAHVWRNGQPGYDLVNTEYLKNRTKQWPKDSLEWVVESLVKTFELEISHKVKPEYIKSCTANFKYSQNGGPKISMEEVLQRGSYNILINDDSYVSEAFDFEGSHDAFKTAFPQGFAWEVVEVLAGPPNVVFKWHHWGSFNGPYAGFQQTNQRIDMYGTSIARVNEQLQIEELEIFYDATPFLSDLTKGGKCPLGFGSK